MRCSKCHTPSVFRRARCWRCWVRSFLDRRGFDRAAHRWWPRAERVLSPWLRGRYSAVLADPADALDEAVVRAFLVETANNHKRYPATEADIELLQATVRAIERVARRDHAEQTTTHHES